MDFFGPSAFHLGMLKINPPGLDNDIHISSAWKIEKAWSDQDTRLLGLVFRSQRLWSRANLLLHTPLELIVKNQGPEEDIQTAIDEIESECEALTRLVSIPRLDGECFPIYDCSTTD